MFQKLEFPGYRGWYLGRHQILLPDRTVWQIEQAAAAAERDEDEGSGANLRGKESEATSVGSPSLGTSAGQEGPAALNVPEASEACGQSTGDARVQASKPLGIGVHSVYSDSEVHTLRKNLGLRRDSDDQARLKKIVQALEKLPTHRKIAAPEGLSTLHALRETHPHFVEVLDTIEQRLVAARSGAKLVRLPPLLLVGAPGIGKTHFAQALANALGAPYAKIALDTQASDSTLLGLDKKWSNSMHGRLFELICLGEYANPVVVLDELDKCGRDNRDDALAPLHTLLEPVSAKAVRDLSLDFEFDASLVTWIATANNAGIIPSSLRSRCTEVVVTMPNAEDSIRIAIEVVACAVRDLAPAGFVIPDRRFAVAIAHETAREIRKAMEEAISKAIFNKRMFLVDADLPQWILDETSAQGEERSWLH